MPEIKKFRGALWAAALALLAAALYRHFSPFLRPDDVWFLNEAEAFYHGLPLRSGLDSMPLTGYYYSLGAHHLPAGWERFFLPFAVISLLGATFAAGSALCGAPGGIVAAGLAGLEFLTMGGLVNWGRYFETVVFTLLTGLTALFLVYYRDSGRLRDAVMLGLLAGASLLCRSTFFLFPPFILAALWLTRGEKKISAGAAAVVLALPYAMLVPWWLMRHSLGLDFALFETFRAKANIITGLLGYVHTIEGSYQEALALAGITGTQDLWTWGLEQVSTHPLVLAKAVLLRAWTVLAYKPSLSILLTASLFIARLDDKARLLWSFLLYFSAVHLPMPVEARYFVPLIPLAAALTARASLVRRDPYLAAFAGDAVRAKAAAWALAVLLLAPVPALYARMLRYPAALASGTAATAASEAAAYPGDPWLAAMAGEADFEARHRRALALQDAGKYAEALGLLEGLLKDRPGDAALWSDKGMQEVRLGRKEKARASFKKAVELDPGFIPAYLNLLSLTPDKAAAGKLRAAALANLKPQYEGLRPLLNK